ncbi:phosphopantothenoylcysteine decarboxylase [Prolixibacter sp. SD074]|uniref:phosphopantothenoylcysteine decarboxylase n=1 Tax=Prolixibacter sp. SD074 TaxID=2652391 RepID=UPI00280A556C|nr:phosphopantothenoylcysteine decarboxylase [Prolixibacter sp. SD074]
MLNKTFLVTAGPTHEKIDPVRFIGNYSSGKMGYAIATCLADSGAEVILVSGPTALGISHPNIRKIDVTSADEMYQASLSAFPACDGAVMSAAVSDYAPVKKEQQKVKRAKGNYTIELKPNPDIAASLGEIKKEGQLLVGFALETHDEENNARIKLEKKNLDFIVLNSLQDKGAGFQHDTNRITIIERNGTKHNFGLKPKTEVAADIVNAMLDMMERK